MLLLYPRDWRVSWVGICIWARTLGVPEARAASVQPRYHPHEMPNSNSPLCPHSTSKIAQKWRAARLQTKICPTGAEKVEHMARLPRHGSLLVFSLRPSTQDCCHAARLPPVVSEAGVMRDARRDGRSA
ncbi:hypothetical protein C8Q80DRAFT_5810 [Daedaleopsis nitida]|nr:hypothetical protein C8Q80DRAFT_5810 [Daedaleopsis nitida]